MRDPSIVNDQIEAIRWSFSKFCKILVVDVLGNLNDLPVETIQLDHATRKETEASALHANYGIRYLLEKGFEFPYAVTLEDDALPISTNLDLVFEEVLNDQQKECLIGFVDDNPNNQKFSEKMVVFEMCKTMAFWKYTGNTAPPKYPIRTGLFVQNYQLTKKLHKNGFYGKDVHDWPFPGSFFQSWASNMVGANSVFLSQDLIYDPALTPIGNLGFREIQDKTILVNSVKNNSFFLEEEARAFFKNKRQSSKKMVSL